MSFSYGNSALDTQHHDQRKRFVEQGGVKYLEDFLNENSMKMHCDLVSVIMENVQAWQDRKLNNIGKSLHPVFLSIKIEVENDIIMTLKPLPIQCYQYKCLKVSKSQKQILKFSSELKMNENIFVFLPWLSKMGQIKKTNANYHIGW